MLSRPTYRHFEPAVNENENEPLLFSVSWKKCYSKENSEENVFIFLNHTNRMGRESYVQTTLREGRPTTITKSRVNCSS